MGSHKIVIYVFSNVFILKKHLIFEEKGQIYTGQLVDIWARQRIKAFLGGAVAIYLTVLEKEQQKKYSIV